MSSSGFSLQDLLQSLGRGLIGAPSFGAGVGRGFQDYNQRQDYNSLLARLTAPGSPGNPVGTGTPTNNFVTADRSGMQPITQPKPAGVLAGTSPNVLSIFQGLSPELGLPMLLNTAMQANSPQVEVKELADGRYQRFNKLTGEPVGQPYGPRKMVTTHPGDTLWGDAGDATDGGTPPSATPTPSAGQPISLDAFASRVAMNESGGKPDARNPLSSATGASQFIGSTWTNLLKSARPDLTNGKSLSDILALRTDPKLAGEMTAVYAKQNADALTRAGIPVNAATLYLAHGFGADGATRILNSKPDTLVSDLVGADVLKANPYLKGMTSGQLVQRFAGKVGTDPVAGLSSAAAPDAASPMPGYRQLYTAPPDPKSQWRYVAAGTPESAANGGMVGWQNGSGDFKPAPQANQPLPPGATGAIDLAAQQYILTGQMPALGLNSGPMRTAILTRANELLNQTGGDASTVVNNAVALRGRYGASGTLARGAAQTAVNEGTVNNSIQILRNLIPTAANHGPFTDLNSAIQWFGRKTNDTNAVNFKNAVDSISAEYARVMTGATSGAPSSDKAREEAAQRILLGYNTKTLPAVLDQMQAEMAGRSNSYSNVLGQVTGGAYHGPTVPKPMVQPNAMPPGATQSATNPQTGQRVFLLNGRWVDSSGKPVN